MIAGIIAFIVTYFILNALNLNNSLALIIAVVVGVFVARTRKKSKEGKEGKGQDPAARQNAPAAGVAPNPTAAAAPGQTANGAAAVAGQPSVARPHGGQGADGDFNWQQTTYEQPAPEPPKRLDEHGNLVTPDPNAPRWADAAQSVRSGSATVADKSWKPRTDGQRVVWRKPVIVNNFVDDYADFGCDGLFNTDLSTAGDHIHGQPGVGLGESGFGAARIQQGQQGELALAQLLCRTGVLRYAYSWWSLSIPGHPGPDVDCALLLRDTLWLLDAKQYRADADYYFQSQMAGEQAADRNAKTHAIDLFKIDESLSFADRSGAKLATNSTLVKTYEPSNNMAWAAGIYEEEFPMLTIKPVVLLSPTKRGIAGIMDQTYFPGGVPFDQSVSFVQENLKPLVDEMASGLSQPWRPNRLVVEQLDYLLKH
ncbi:hypothetical protein ACE15Y_00585 [Bifidobacterium bifidum]|uniref:hypothetical protein n=1 Tax=Bifidobacterium bifidum TaxID=1681 RepID=UPI001C22B36C|nr:hypothetical protein [Bifidobacterium bifidum]MBU8984056.1 hypothetical protein [Bifidobacterium bifidum]MBU8987359.1 hypothetical protein [Bifidobacterium bifidum]